MMTVQATVGTRKTEKRPPSSRPGDLSGRTNQNPPDMSLLALLAEDFRTYGRDPTEPGFWALAVHRFGNWRMDIRPRVLRAPFSVAYRAMHTGVNWLWGIDVGYATKVGRRVRIWHHGGVVIGARAIGDDVHLRHNVTIGVVHRDVPVEEKPIIEDRVDIGVGAAILGDITIGHDSVIGANSVVVRDFPPHSTVLGVPARPVKFA
jgi:serine O-acetyltransferase